MRPSDSSSCTPRLSNVVALSVSAAAGLGVSVNGDVNSQDSIWVTAAAAGHGERSCRRTSVMARSASESVKVAVVIAVDHCI